MLGRKPDTSDIGDVPIDFRMYQLTVRDAAALSGVPERTVRNWEARVSGIGIGYRTWRHLRFSLRDVIQLHVMFYLAIRLGIALEHAVRIGSFAAEMVCETVLDPATGKISGSPLGNSVLVGFGDDGQVSVGTASIAAPGHYLPPSFERDAKSVLRRPHIMIPVDAIRRNLVERVCAMTRQTQTEEPADG
jgi:hypothetical protein